MREGGETLVHSRPHTEADIGVANGVHVVTLFTA
jgi:hypothetical protein